MKRWLAGIIARLSPDLIQQGNIWRSARTGMFTTANATLISIPAFQVFALRFGASEAQLGVVRFFAQLAYVAGFLLFTRRAARIPTEKLIPSYTKLTMYQIALPTALLVSGVFLLFGWAHTLISLAVITAGWMLSNFLSSYHTMVMTRIEACLYSPGIYGAVFGFCGVLFYGVSAILGMGMEPLLSEATADWGFLAIFAVSLALGFASFLSARGYQLISASPLPSDGAEEKVHHIATEGQTLRICLIHLLRGIVSGVYYFVVPIGLRYFGLRSADVGFLTVAVTLAGIIAYLFILYMTDKLGVVRSSLFSMVLSVAALAILLVYPERWVFIAAYFVYGIGNAIFSQVVPIGILQTTPQSNLAVVTAVRLVALQLADALTSLVLGSVVLPHYKWFLLLTCVLMAVNMVLITRCLGGNSRITASPI